VTLFERNDDVGGRVRSRDVDGFTLDRGFQVLFTAYPAAQRELDLHALDLREFTPGATIVRPGQRSTLSDPLRDPKALTATLFNREITLLDKLRILSLRRDLSAKSPAEALDDDDVTIEQFLRRRGFSRQFRDHFVAPFYGGITLDRSLSSSRAIFEYTFKMLSQGRTVIPADGMGAIPAQLADRATATGASIETGTRVEDVAADGDGATVETPGETVEAEAAIVATDPPTAQELTGIDSIPTTARSCVTQHFALPPSQHLDSGKRLLLNAANDRPNQVAPMSAVAPGLTPGREQLLSATFLGEQEADDRELAEEVRDALTSWFPENQFGGLELLTTDRIKFAQFAEPPGFRADLPAVDAPDGEIYLAGDYTSWSSIQGAMESGREAGLAVLSATHE
jgi:phytoene dehydrogenase-like protein